MSHLTTDEARSRADERDTAILWLRVKCVEGTAGLDENDSAVMIVEVASPDRAWRLDLIGHTLHACPHVRPDHSTCIRVRAILEADVRVALDLDGPSPPTLDTALASRKVPLVLLSPVDAPTAATPPVGGDDATPPAESQHPAADEGGQQADEAGDTSPAPVSSVPDPALGGVRAGFRDHCEEIDAVIRGIHPGLRRPA